MANSYELYVAPRPEGWTYSVWGEDIESHLTETGLIERAFSLDDELIKGWLANPTIFPDELKSEIVDDPQEYMDKRIMLWGSVTGDKMLARYVTYLTWYNGTLDWRTKGLTVNKTDIHDRMGDESPALLKPAQE